MFVENLKDKEIIYNPKLEEKNAEDRRIIK